MIFHHDLMVQDVHYLIRHQKIKVAGNVRLKIFGRLNCKSGKRMKKENRVFFKNESEALENMFRPCGHCMKKEYEQWKSKVVFQYSKKQVENAV